MQQRLLTFLFGVSFFFASAIAAYGSCFERGGHHNSASHHHGAGQHGEFHGESHPVSSAIHCPDTKSYQKWGQIVSNASLRSRIAAEHAKNFALSSSQEWQSALAVLSSAFVTDGWWRRVSFLIHQSPQVSSTVLRI